MIGAQSQICVNLRQSGVSPSAVFFAFLAIFCGYSWLCLNLCAFASLREIFLFRSGLFLGLAYRSIHVPRFFPWLLDGRQDSGRLPMKLVSLGGSHGFKSAGYRDISR